MTRARNFLRSLTLALVVWGCADKITGPQQVVATGQIGVYADLGPSGVTTLVIQASGPGIVKPDGSPDTLAFNINLVSGVASGSVQIPAGPSRVITARAFVGVTETHRGSVTANVLEGNNPTLQITLVPLVGNVPLTVSIGSTIVVVRPLLASLAVGDTLRLSAEVRDHNGNLVSGPVRWATLNPLRAGVDTLGLVTMRDTGEVQIVATYGTVGGASKITGASALSAAPYHLRWNGSVNTNWSEPNNWTPHGIGTAHVPTLSDSVVVPAGVSNMPRLNTCVDANAVRDILIETGASLTTSCYALNVYRSAVVRGSIITVHLRPNASIAGNFADIQVLGAGARLSDNVVATSVNVNIPVGSFSLNTHTLRTTNDFNVSDGTVTMADGDTLIVGGNVSWSGDDHTGLLSGGVVHSRGNQFYGYRYYATGTNRLVFDRTATGQQIIGGFDYVSNPNNAQVRRLEIRNRDGVNLCGHIRVTDTLSFVSSGTPAAMVSCSSYLLRAQGPFVTSANTDVASYSMDLRHVSGTSLVAGTWHPSITEFGVDDAVIQPTLNYGNLRFVARNTLPANMTITGYLYLNGASAELDLAGNRLQVGNYLETNNGATIKMLTAADSLIVGEYAYFPHDFHVAQKAKLTGGVLSVGSYLTGYGFASAGTKLVMSGTSTNSQKYISGVNYESRPAQTLHDLEIAADATYGLCERVKVMNNLRVKSGARLQEWCGGSYLVVMTDLLSEATSTVNPYLVSLVTAAGTSNVAGAFSPTITDFDVANAIVKPGLAYQNIRFKAPTQLTGTTTATGYVYLTGAGVDLAINGQTLTVGEYFQTDNNSTLTMNNAADVVTIGRYAYFNSATSTIQNTKLTAGTMNVGEYMYGPGFSASGTHRVVMTGASTSTSKYISGLNFESRATQGFQNLEIAAGKTYGLCERVAVKGELKVNTGATLQEWCGNSYIRIDGDVVAATGSTIQPYNVQLYTAFGTQNVNGTFAPTYTSVYTAAAAGQLKAGLGYLNMQFLTPASLSTNMTVNGDLNVNGPATVLTLNGKELTVIGNLNVQNNATLVMNNALDVLDVAGNVAWTGGGIQAGKLTNGTTIFRGVYVCAQNYETSGSHTTVFDRAGGMVRFACVSSSSTAQLMRNVTVQGAGVTLECSMNVSNDVQVAVGSSLIQNCGNGTLYVGNDLRGATGSAITNGPAYPGDDQLSVVFGGASGTANVNGSYGAYASYFTALNSQIKPTLPGNGIDYKYVRIDQSTAILDTTEIDGQLDVINNAILDLGGNTLVVKGVMNFDNSAKLRMTSPNDTLVVASGDAAADFYWDGGDNTSDGSPLLTNGVIMYYGDRFYGLQYKATAGTPHKFIFANNTGGTVSVEGRPSFAQMEVLGSRTVYVNDLTLVQDNLTMSANTTLSGTNYVQVQGDLKTAATSDVNIPNVYLDGKGGTKFVNGRFRPTTVFFRAAAPMADAIKPGLEYQYVAINGPYSLSGATSFGANLDISGATARLTMNGQRLAVTGRLDLYNDGTLTMNNPLDSLGVGDYARFQWNAGATTVMSAGVLSVAGPSWNMERDGIEASGSHTLVMKGIVPQTLNAWQGGNSRGLNNVRVDGTAPVEFNYGMKVIGTFTVTAGATAKASNGTLKVSGAVNVGAGATFTVYTGSTFSSPMTTSGLLIFSGSAVSTSTLQVLTGGIARAASSSPTTFVDFSSIILSGGALETAVGGGGFRPLPASPAMPLADLSLSSRR